MQPKSILTVALMIAVLTGCAARVDLDRDPDYTRADVDAINATSQCKQLARTMVQVARCETRR